MPKISDLPNSGVPDGADVLPIVDATDTVTKKVSVTDLAGSAMFAEQYVSVTDARVVPTPAAEAAGRVPSTDGAGGYELVPVSSYTAGATAALVTDASADVDDVPMAPSTTLARLASGGIVAATVAQMQTLLGVGSTTAVNAITVPPAGMITSAGGAGTAWVEDRAYFSRFSLDVTTTVRYINWATGTTVSGNVQAGIVALSGTDHLTATRVAHTGIVACPSAGEWQLDMGTVDLEPGDYAAFFWCDNAIATFYTGSSNNGSRGRLTFLANSLAAGVGADPFTISVSTVFLAGLAIEGNF